MSKLIIFQVLVICLAVVKGDILKFVPHEFQKDISNLESQGPLKNGGVHWALIVAGSAGWYNYRHQADACHAYHIMIKHGIPAERIVTMMVDDLANNTLNPTPGIVINHPDGQDVYKGVVIDYKGMDVTPENFLAALSGKSEQLKGVGSGKVINSGPNDHIFVNFVDHGAPGILGFPTKMLKARDFMNTITEMHSDNKYGQMVFYIEACESGSMFEGLLPKDINVYATTAANSHESSYACYFDKERQTYLGDVYSVNWMEDSDKEDLNMETLHKQYEIVKEETNTSHVMEFGDNNIGDETCGEFQGNQGVDPITYSKVTYDAVPSEDVPLAILYKKLESAQNNEALAEIHTQISHLLHLQARIHSTFKDIVGMVSRDIQQSDRILRSRYRLTAFDCYEPIVDLFSERCFDLTQHEYALRRLFLLVNLCEEQVPTESILEAIAKVCKS